MKRFKIIFHIVYILITLVVMYFTIDILMNTEAYLSKVKLSAYIKFPKYIMGIFLFLSVLMIVEYVMQQLRIRNIKSNIEGLENQVKELKAKLYDQGQTEISEISYSETDETVSEEDEEDDDPA